MAKNGTDRTKTNWGRSKESRMLHSAASDLSRSRHCIFPKVVVAHQKAWIFERTTVQDRVNHQIIIISGVQRRLIIVSMPELLLRQRRCNACQAMFGICTHCDRGQRYCSEPCRKQRTAAATRPAIGDINKRSVVERLTGCVRLSIAECRDRSRSR